MANCLKDFYRRKRLKESRPCSKAAFTNLMSVESVSFAYQIESSEDIGEIMEIYTFLKWKNVKVQAIVVETKKGVLQKLDLSQLEANEDITIVPYSSLDWIGDLKQGVADSFLRSHTNLFINFNSKNSFTLKRVAQRVMASMVIGMVNEPYIPYNFIVGGKDGVLLDNVEYLNQIFHYLKIFNKQ